MEEVETQYMKKDVTPFNIGDTIRVSTRITEGEKERLQAFIGTVIAKKGMGLSETFTLYRNAYGSSMDRVFLLHSPRISAIEVIRPGKVRRAKLYYLQGRSGKAAKVREQYVASNEVAAPVAPAPEIPSSEG
ncbi:MAG: 50S ribosomal protein L19 [Chlamydiota bacterium]